MIIFLKKRRIKESSDEIWIKTLGWLSTSNCNTDSVTGAMSKAEPSLFCRGVFQANSELLSRPFQKMPHTSDSSCLEGVSPLRGKFSGTTKALLLCRGTDLLEGRSGSHSSHCACCDDPQTHQDPVLQPHTAESWKWTQKASLIPPWTTPGCCLCLKYTSTYSFILCEQNNSIYIWGAEPREKEAPHPSPPSQYLPLFFNLKTLLKARTKEVV